MASEICSILIQAKFIIYLAKNHTLKFYFYFSLNFFKHQFDFDSVICEKWSFGGSVERQLPSRIEVKVRIWIHQSSSQKKIKENDSVSCCSFRSTNAYEILLWAGKTSKKPDDAGDLHLYYYRYTCLVRQIRGANNGECPFLKKYIKIAKVKIF